MMLKSARLQGIFVGSREMFEEMNRAISLAGMRPVIDRVFEFGELHEALESYGERRAFRENLSFGCEADFSQPVKPARTDESVSHRGL